MRTFNELNEAYERTMLARTEPEREKTMREKPTNSEIFDWDQFEEWADIEGVGKETEDWMPWWECWKEGYAAGVESTVEDDDEDDK